MTDLRESAGTDFVPKFFTNQTKESFVDDANIESFISFQTVMPVLAYARGIVEDGEISNVTVVADLVVFQLPEK